MQRKDLLFVMSIFILGFTFTSAQLKDKPGSQTQSISAPEVYTKMNINNISTFIFNNGSADLAVSGDSGWQYPIGSGNTCFYESGFVWGGKINGQIRAGGSSFMSSLMPGRILPNGLPDNPASSNVRAFRVRPDFKTANLSQEEKDEGKNKLLIYNQYEKDWNEWPANFGAPFSDVNKNGTYEATIDIPGVPGADQTIWFVANDLDSTQTKKTYAALPFGVEMQTTVWAYKGSEQLKNTIFKRYLIINKSKTKIEEMYLGIWSDADVGGDAADDLSGCDSLLNMVFMFNGDNSDPSYGAYIPAAGFRMLQGPIINGMSNDAANFKGKKIYGKKNLPMTAFGWISKYGVSRDPYETSSNISTKHLYNLLQGKGNDGTDIYDPITGRITRFPYSGDPITGTGFLGGFNYPNGWKDSKGDHRMMICSGPFNMAPGDTQEVIFSQMTEGGKTGQSRFAAVSLLKQTAEFTNIVYKNNFNVLYSPGAMLNANVTEMDREIILTWGEDRNAVSQIENTSSQIFSFQGYNVYQISKNEQTLGQKKRIATFDLADLVNQVVEEEVDPVTGMRRLEIKQFGTNSGIQRFISIKKDYWNNTALNNGSDYDFGVSYYQTRSDQNNFIFKSVESPLNIFTVKPQSPKPGIRYEGKYGDIISAAHTAGVSKAAVSAMIIDPTKTTGDDYEVTFARINNKTLFALKNISSNTILLSGQSNLSGDNDYFITDGFILKVKDNLSGLLTEKDVYRFKTPNVIYDQTLAGNDLEKINVFPNPYYGSYKNEFSKYDRHVTFSHLPQRAVIRIFNLAGQLVRKIDKDSPGQFERWNMLNENNYQIPTGLYIVNIELPEYGKSKTLKLAILTNAFSPDNF